MNKLAIAFIIIVGCLFNAANTASAQYPGFYGGVSPFAGGLGFSGGFGSGYRSPPYFSVNPPVYYGARYARPYGISPFPSLPLVAAPEGYRARLESEFIQPGVPTSRRSNNPCISYSSTVLEASAKPVTPGPIRSNPFVGSL